MCSISLNYPLTHWLDHYPQDITSLRSYNTLRIDMSIRPLGEVVYKLLSWTSLFTNYKFKHTILEHQNFPSPHSLLHKINRTPSHSFPTLIHPPIPLQYASHISRPFLILRSFCHTINAWFWKFRSVCQSVSNTSMQSSEHLLFAL